MPILAAGQRRFLFEKNPLYVFSFDAPLKERSRVGVFGGTNIDWSVPDDAKADKLQAYHVLDEDTVEENDAVRGAVLAVRDLLFLPNTGKTGAVEGNAIIKTYDDAVIDARYRGSVDLGSLSNLQFDPSLTHAVDETIKEDQKACLKVRLAVRFETEFPKYKWLTQYQCAAFGRLNLVDRRVKDATYDVYAMR
jgi:hypothetical protein